MHSINIHDTTFHVALALSMQWTIVLGLSTALKQWGGSADAVILHWFYFLFYFKWLFFFCFIRVQTSISLCYFLNFMHWSKSFYLQQNAESQISKLLLSSYDVSQSKPNQSMQATLEFGTIARPLEHLCCRSKCIWWDSYGAISATCDFTSC